MKTEAMMEDTEVEEEDTTSSGVSKADAAKWKKLILGINEKKLLTYIQDLISARLDLGRAEFNLTKVDKKLSKNNDSKSCCGPSEDDWYSNKNIKLKPIGLPIEKENYDEA